MAKLLSLFAVLLIITTVVAQDKDMDPEAAKLYNQGNQSVKSGDYEGALTSYDNALKTSKDYRIYYQKGVTLKKLRKFEQAEDAFNKCISANPKFAVGYNGLGGTYFADNKFSEAADAFKKFAELSSKAEHKKQANEYIARSYTKLGESAKADGKQEKAIEYLNEAVKFFPFDAAYLLLAEVYVNNVMYDKALEAADKALNNLKTIPRGGPYYYKGRAFLGKKDITKAKEAFEAGKKDKSYKDLCEYELKMMLQ